MSTLEYISWQFLLMWMPIPRWRVPARTKHLSVDIRSEFIHWALWTTLIRTEYFLFVHHTTSILTKFSIWCFEQSGDISCSLIVNPKQTDESWEGRSACLSIYTLWICSLSTLKNTDENRIFFVHSPHHKHFGKAQHLVLWVLWWHQLFSTR